MGTELFNTWEETWNEIDSIWNESELTGLGFSENWVYYIWQQDRTMRLIRIDRESVINNLEISQTN